MNICGNTWKTIVSRKGCKITTWSAQVCALHTNERFMYHRKGQTHRCTPEVLRLYIEQQFEPGMTWDNSGTAWAPVASFKNLDTDELEQFQMNLW